MASSTRPPKRRSPRVAVHELDETDAAIDAAAAAAPSWKTRHARRPRAPAASLRRGRRRAHRRARPARGRQLGPHHLQRALGGRQRSRRPALLLGRARTALRSSRSPSPGASTSPSTSRSASSASSCPGTSPCPSPAGDSRPPSPRATPSSSSPRRSRRSRAIRLGELALEAGIPEGVFQVVTGDGSMVGQSLRHPPRRAQGLLHRFERRGAAHHGGLRRTGQARHARARRQEREHHLRRRRPREGRRQRALRRVRQRGPGLLRAVAAPGPGVRLRPIHGALRAGGEGRQGARSHQRRQRDGPAHHGRPARERARLRRRVRRRLPRQRARRPRVLDGPDGARDERPRRADRSTKRSSVPSSRSCAFDDEAEAIAIANESPYGLSGSIWSRDIGRALRVARGVETGALSINSNSSVRYSTPFGGFQAVGARSRARTRRAARFQ